MSEVSNSPLPVYELRAVGGGPIIAGHYDNLDLLMKYAKTLNDSGRNVYRTLNPIVPGSGRKLNGVNELPQITYTTAEDTDIGRITVLIYDIDPERLNPDGSPFRLYELPDGSLKQFPPDEVKKFNAAAKLADTPKLKRVQVAANDAEKNEALAIARKLFTFWKARGADVTVIDSGNGYYVIVRVDLATADKLQIENILDQHAAEFNTPGASIDTSAANPSRITRVPGTVNRKGPNSSERPHRTANVLFHQDGRTFSAEDLRAMFPVKEKQAAQASAPVSDEKQKESCERMEGFLDHHDIGHAQRKPWKGGYIYHLDEDEDKCPNGEDGENSHSTENLHSTISCMVSASGKLGYKCCHGNCSKLKWPEFKEFHERAAAKRQDEAIKAYGEAVNRGESPVIKLKDFRGSFFKSEVIKSEVNLPEPFVWTLRKSSAEEERSSQSGPLWLFSTEEEYAVFKLRVEQTPAWAFDYCPTPDPDFAGPGRVKNTDYESWRKAKYPSGGSGEGEFSGVASSDVAASPVARRFTDLGNAELLVAKYGENFRYLLDAEEWRYFDGRRWSANSAEIHRAAKATVRAMSEEAVRIDDMEKRATFLKFALRSESDHNLNRMVSRARHEKKVEALSSDFDQDQWLLNVQNGTVDLRTGALRPPRREDLITKMCSVEFDPSAKCPRWERFLSEIFPGQPDVVGFLQRSLGYSLTGETGERCIWFLIGDRGQNGKTLLMSTIRHLLGDYAATTNFDTFLLKRSGSNAHNPRDGMADLAGARIVWASESDEGKRISEAQLKALTGGESIKAAKLYKDAVEQKPTYKIWLSTNHPPNIKGTDEALWGRFRRVNFNYRVPDDKVDLQLGDKLKAEASGILNWLLAGLANYQIRRLDPPKEVKSATEEYRQEQSIVGRFYADQCLRTNDQEYIEASALFNGFQIWAQASGEREARFMTQTKFGREMKTLRPARQITAGNSKGRLGYFGIQMAASVPTPPRGVDASGTEAWIRAAEEEAGA